MDSMITNNREVAHFFEKANGKGTTHIERLLSDDCLQPQAAMYAKVTLDVGASIGIHSHTNDSESYYILQGTANYTDNGTEHKLTAGACTYTAKGSFHGIENIGEEPLIFIALILNH